MSFSHLHRLVHLGRLHRDDPAMHNILTLVRNLINLHESINERKLSVKEQCDVMAAALCSFIDLLCDMPLASKILLAPLLRNMYAEHVKELREDVMRMDLGAAKDLAHDQRHLAERLESSTLLFEPTVHAHMGQIELLLAEFAMQQSGKRRMNAQQRESILNAVLHNHPCSRADVTVVRRMAGQSPAETAYLAFVNNHLEHHLPTHLTGLDDYLKRCARAQMFEHALTPFLSRLGKQREKDEYIECFRFLALKALSPCEWLPETSKLAPSYHVDQVWHDVILDTRVYTEMCEELLGPGGRIHHINKYLPEYEARTLRTHQAYFAAFREVPPISYWGKEKLLYISLSLPAAVIHVVLKNNATIGELRKLVDEFGVVQGPYVVRSADVNEKQRPRNSFLVDSLQRTKTKERVEAIIELLEMTDPRYTLNDPQAMRLTKERTLEAAPEVFVSVTVHDERPPNERGKLATIELHMHMPPSIIELRRQIEEEVRPPVGSEYAVFLTDTTLLDNKDDRRLVAHIRKRSIIRVHFRAARGDSVSLDLDTVTTFEQCREILGLDASELFSIAGGRSPNENEFLWEYGIENDATIHFEQNAGMRKRNQGGEGM